MKEGDPLKRHIRNSISGYSKKKGGFKPRPYLYFLRFKLARIAL